MLKKQIFTNEIMAGEKNIHPNSPFPVYVAQVAPVWDKHVYSYDLHTLAQACDKAIAENMHHCSIQAIIGKLNDYDSVARVNFTGATDGIMYHKQKTHTGEIIISKLLVPIN